jgi:hypothetical protein
MIEAGCVRRCKTPFRFRTIAYAMLDSLLRHSKTERIACYRKNKRDRLPDFGRWTDR